MSEEGVIDALSELFREIVEENGEPKQISSKKSYEITKRINDGMEYFALRHRELQNEAYVDAVKLCF